MYRGTSLDEISKSLISGICALDRDFFVCRGDDGCRDELEFHAHARVNTQKEIFGNGYKFTIQCQEQRTLGKFALTWISYEKKIEGRLVRYPYMLLSWTQDEDPITRDDLLPGQVQRDKITLDLIAKDGRCLSHEQLGKAFRYLDGLFKAIDDLLVNLDKIRKSSISQEGKCAVLLLAKMCCMACLGLSGYDMNSVVAMVPQPQLLDPSRQGRCNGINDSVIAFVSGRHPRLGADSPVMKLDEPLLRRIAGFATPSSLNDARRYARLIWSANSIGDVFRVFNHININAVVSSLTQRDLPATAGREVYNHEPAVDSGCNIM